MDGSDGCTTMRMDLMPLNGIDVKMVKIMLRVLLQSHKKKRMSRNITDANQEKPEFFI